MDANSKSEAALVEGGWYRLNDGTRVELIRIDGDEVTYAFEGEFSLLPMTMPASEFRAWAAGQ